MPLYMDLHRVEGVTPEALSNAHIFDDPVRVYEVAWRQEASR
jgi:hypothetical protein